MYLSVVHCPKYLIFAAKERTGGLMLGGLCVSTPNPGERRAMRVSLENKGYFSVAICPSPPTTTIILISW